VVKEEPIETRRRSEAYVENPVPAVLAVGLRNVKELDVGGVALDVLPEQLRVILRAQDTCWLQAFMLNEGGIDCINTVVCKT
jgi:hypothetical protein